MFNRRDFIQKLGGGAGALAFSSFLGPTLAASLEAAKNRMAGMSPEACAKEEDFWGLIQQAYSVAPTPMNLNNGGVSPQPKVVQEAFEHYNRMSNQGPSYYMWKILDFGREPLREHLASMAGCSADEIAINRNASEALETIIFGLRLEKGDEVVLSKQDYPNMINAWKQREKRDGIVLKWLDFDLPMEDDSLIVGLYEKAYSAKTKVVHITHMISLTGQILPAKKIIDAARKRGILSVVDAAHSFAHINFKISDIDPDYLGVSLHKWLCAPFGTGMLYVKKSNIKSLWPLFANGDPEKDDIHKFESLGTRSFAAEHAIEQALNFHEYIGADRKQARLFYLKDYWMTRAQKEVPGIRFHTSFKREYSCGISTMSIEGMDTQEVAFFLFRGRYKIHTGIIKTDKIWGLRISPNVYTLEKDLDKLVETLKLCVLAEKKK